MKILLDAMGGDNAPEATIKGAVESLSETSTTTEIVLVGREDVILEKIKEYYGKDKIEDVSPRLSIYNADQEILMTDQPTLAIKKKKDASMVVGFNLLSENKGDCFISAGNSGALLVGATLLVGRIKGVDRPAIAGILPTHNDTGLMLMDCGANTNVKPENLVQFAQMATIYDRNTVGKENPTVGLLNIGTEPTKGNDTVKEAYNLLTANSAKLGINFVGNVEARDAFKGDLDILICDGFTGNVFLKTVEGMGKLVKQYLTENLTKNFLTTIGSAFSLPALNGFKKAMDYREYGGALFLGVKKPVVKAHGSADNFTFVKTIIQAEKFVQNDAVGQMITTFELQKELEKNSNESIDKNEDM